MTIDTKKLRELATKATPGPWRFSDLKDPQDEIEAQLPPAAPDLSGRVRVCGNFDTEEDARFVLACSPDRITALLDALDAADALAEAVDNLERGDCPTPIPECDAALVAYRTARGK